MAKKNNNETKGWIRVRIGFNINGELPKKKVISIFKELSKNLKEGSFYFNKLDDSFGWGNPFVEKPNTIMSANFIEKKLLSKPFITKIEREYENWHIVFAPKSDDELYNLENLHKDLFILFRIDKKIREEMGIEGNPATFNLGFQGKKPLMEVKEELMTFEFDVKKRIEYDSNNLAEICLGDFYDKLKVVKKRKKRTREMNATEEIEREKWLKAVEKLLENKK